MLYIIVTLHHTFFPSSLLAKAFPDAQLTHRRALGICQI
jgi:hypothetical protein